MLLSPLSHADYVNNNGEGGYSSRLNFSYKWKNQFTFTNGKVGYIGLEAHDGGIHTFDFTVDGATSWKREQGNCRLNSFNQVQCDVDAAWKVGHEYRLDVSENGNLITGEVTDLVSGLKTTVGTIKIPDTYGKLSGSKSYIGEMSKDASKFSSCSSLGAQSSLFKNPLGDDRVVAVQNVNTNEACHSSYIVQASCNGYTFINTIGDLRGIPAPDAPQVKITNNADVSAQMIAEAFKHSDLAIVRSMDGTLGTQYYFSSSQ